MLNLNNQKLIVARSHSRSWLSYFIPFTYAQMLIKSLIAESSGLLAHLGRFGVLILYGVVLLFLSSMTLKQRE